MDPREKSFRIETQPEIEANKSRLVLPQGARVPNFKGPVSVVAAGGEVVCKLIMEHFKIIYIKKSTT
jgi:hypothetical protein